MPTTALHLTGTTGKPWSFSPKETPQATNLGADLRAVPRARVRAVVRAAVRAIPRAAVRAVEE